MNTTSAETWCALAFALAFAVSLYRNFVLKERGKDLSHRLDAQMGIDRDLDKRLQLEMRARICAQGKAADAEKELQEASDTARRLREDIGNLNRIISDQRVKIDKLMKIRRR